MLGETGKPVFRKGICTIIGSQQDILLVAQAAAATAAMREFRFDRPDVALLDPRLPGANGPGADQDDRLTIILSVHPGHRHVPTDPAACPAQHADDGAPTPRELKMLQLISISRIWSLNCTAIRAKMLKV